MRVSLLVVFKMDKDSRAFAETPARAFAFVKVSFVVKVACYNYFKIAYLKEDFQNVRMDHTLLDQSNY